MVRFLVLLLSLLLALPAAAVPACHQPAHEQAQVHHHAPAPAMVVHDCLGCIPPGDWRAARVAPAPLAATAPHLPAPAARVAGLATRPTPPPPRAG